MIQENKINYNLEYKVLPNNIYPYFFRNQLIDNNIYLAQNTNNINNALKIERIWQEDGYNIGNDILDNEIEPFNFTLYSYKNSQDILKRYINVASLDNYKILGYKTDTSSVFTPLLKLN